MNNRLLSIALVAIALVWVACSPGHAQPAPAASAPVALTAADITKATKCGAGGVGRVYAGERRGQIESRAPTPGEYVNVRGDWATCKMESKQRDCLPIPLPDQSWWFDGRVCSATPGTILGGVSGRNISPADVYVFTDGYYSPNRKPTDRRGWIVYECRRKPDGSAGWVQINRYCSK